MAKQKAKRKRKQNSSNVAELITDKRLKELLSILTKDSSKIRLTKHVQDRMRQRGIDLLQILRVLGRGEITEQAWFNHTTGDWRFTIKGIAAGTTISVVAALILIDPVEQSYAIVITTHH